MNFSSMFFLWVFLPLLVYIYIYISKGKKIKKKNIYLLIVSLMFYAWGEPGYVCLMLFSILINYFAALLIEKSNYRKIVVIADIGINILLLVYFKYLNFIIESINTIFSLKLEYKNVTLPIGISFFTFQAMSYVIDVYRKECKAESNFIHVALYVAFFPQLIAGPIVKYKDIDYQIRNRKESIQKVAIGIRRFCYGLGKKVIVSNMLAMTVDNIIALDIVNVSWYLAWTAAIMYSLQIYYDFSGYSDMAIGLAKIFGFDIEENFHYPYLSKSITEFWRRWHISLGSWFRDYVYIPMGGNRKGKIRTNINLAVVFFLTGVWHGASWNFIVWGIYHGFFVIVERLGLLKLLKKSVIFAHFYTVLIFVSGWIFFRLTDLIQIVEYLKRMFIPWCYAKKTYSFLEIVNLRTLLILVFAIAGCGIIQTVIEKDGKLKQFKGGFLELLYCASMVALCFILLASNSYNPFIYFRF